MFFLKKNILEKILIDIVRITLFFLPIFLSAINDNICENQVSGAVQELLAEKSEIQPDITDIIKALATNTQQPPEIVDPEEDIPLATRSTMQVQPKKHITFLTYMAADNNLAYFAKKNLDQQAQIGSNNLLNIVTELDTRLAGNKKVTKLYYVKKNQLVILNNDDTKKQKLDSGDPETLVNFCRFAIKNFPADHYVLILWNHGTGIIDIGQYSAFNSSKLFRYNPEINMLELDRSIPFLEFITPSLPDPRGLCFDDTTGHYISNQGLEYALNTICNECLGGKKIDIIGFDACLMSMLEIGNILKDYAEYMVGSQEVELALGWRYDTVLAPAAQQKITMEFFAQHLVETYHDMYHKITKDYTQSAVALNNLSSLEENVNNVAVLLLEALKYEKNNTMRDALKASRHKLFCTHFVEKSFVDLGHFYANLLNNVNRFEYTDNATGKLMQQAIIKTLQQGLAIIQQSIVANIVGHGLSKAQGISIYFPEQRIHHSYAYTKFARTNHWGMLLQKYIQL